MPLRRRLILTLLMIAGVASAGENGSITFQSAEQQTALLELYTSEGCSSCPPAETWLSRLVDSPQLWRDFVPVAFHVDYWDYLGWHDPWAARQFSERQRNYAAKWHSDSIYTPEFVLNGEEWRNWSAYKRMPTNSPVKAGIVSVSSTDTNNWRVQFTSTSRNQASYEVRAVWLVSHVTSDVKAGENRGKRLNHEFVAMSFTNSPMQRRNDRCECELHLLMPTNGARGRWAIAVWITELGKLEPVQATGGWLSKPSVNP